MSFLPANIEQISGDAPHLLSIDPNSYLEKKYNRLYRAHMHHLQLTAAIALDPNDSRSNDRLLMDILDALNRIEQHEDLPVRLSFGSLEARVMDNYSIPAES